MTDLHQSKHELGHRPGSDLLLPVHEHRDGHSPAGRREPLDLHGGRVNSQIPPVNARRDLSGPVKRDKSGAKGRDHALDRA